MTSPRDFFSIPHYSPRPRLRANKFWSQPPLSRPFVSILSCHESDSDFVAQYEQYNKCLVKTTVLSQLLAPFPLICQWQQNDGLSPAYNKHRLCWQCLNFQPWYHWPLLEAKCNCNVRRSSVQFWIFIVKVCQNVATCHRQRSQASAAWVSARRWAVDRDRSYYNLNVFFIIFNYFDHLIWNSSYKIYLF